MFGWIQDHLVLGVIDEIDLRPLYIALRPQPTSTGSSFVDAKQTKLQVVGKRDSAKAGGAIASTSEHASSAAEESELPSAPLSGFAKARAEAIAALRTASSIPHPPRPAPSRGFSTRPPPDPPISSYSSPSRDSTKPTEDPQPSSSLKTKQYASQDEYLRATAKLARERKIKAKLRPKTKSSSPRMKAEKAKDKGMSGTKTEAKMSASPNGKGKNAEVRPLTSFFAVKEPLAPTKEMGAHPANAIEVDGESPHSHIRSHSASGTPKRKASAGECTPSPPKSMQSPLPSPITSTEDVGGFGYFLSDSKTRHVDLLPRVTDQFQARNQCMLYRRLMDGFFVGIGERSDNNRDGQPKMGEKDGANQSGSTMLDPHAYPVTLDTLQERLQLDAHLVLSDAFLEDAVPLVEGYGLELQGSHDHGVTLAHLFAQLQGLLRQLRERSREGYVAALRAAGYHDGDTQDVTTLVSARAPTIADELTLVYRRRGEQLRKNGRFARKRHATATAASGAERRVSKRIARRERDKLAVTTSAPASNPAEGGMTPAAAAATEDDLTTAVELSLAVADEQNKISTHTLTPSGTPRTSQQTPASSVRSATAPVPTDPALPAASPTHKPGSRADGTVIGRAHFRHDAPRLEAYLSDVLSMWEGTRALRGVSDATSHRCGFCEYADDCEWRAIKAVEYGQGAEARRAARQADALALERKRVEAAHRLAARLQDEVVLEQLGRKESTDAEHSSSGDSSHTANLDGDPVDADDQLWSQFDDVSCDEWDKAKSQVLS